MKRAKVSSISAQERAARAAVVDELGAIEQRLAEVDMLARRREKLRAEIRSWFSDCPADGSGTVDGRRYSVDVSACENTRRITSMAGVYKRLGADFFDYCSFSLSALDRMIAPRDQGTLVTQDRTGPRRLVVSELLREAA